MSVNLLGLPEVNFAELDTGQVEAAIIRMYEGITNTVLYPGDPVRLFLSTLAAENSQLRQIINRTGQMNLLRYARGIYLDHLGALLDVERLDAAPARTVLEFQIAAPHAFAVLVPQGVRATADGVVFWATDETLTIQPGETAGAVPATCQTDGLAQNGLVPGQINRLVDPLAYIVSVANTETTSSGADVEDDDRLRERIRIKPESFTTAGSELAYIYWALSAHQDILDVSVISEPLFPPGEVRLFVLLTGGRLPTPDGAEIALVTQAVNAKRVRPLTDHVFVAPASAVEVDYAFTWYITEAQAGSVADLAGRMDQAAAAYEEWQTGRLGRDLNPDRLIRLAVGAGAKRVEVVRITHDVDGEGKPITTEAPFSFEPLDGMHVAKFLPRADRVRFGAIEGD